MKVASIVTEGNARVGLEILRRAGRRAESKRLRKVIIYQIKQAIRGAKRLKNHTPFLSLVDIQKIIYQMPLKRKKTSSG